MRIAFRELYRYYYDYTVLRDILYLFVARFLISRTLSKSTTKTPYWKALSEDYGQWYTYCTAIDIHNVKKCDHFLITAEYRYPIATRTAARWWSNSRPIKQEYLNTKTCLLQWGQNYCSSFIIRHLLHIRQSPIRTSTRRPTILSAALMVFLNPSKQMLDCHLIIGHSDFQSHSFKLVIHKRSII
jgi:hypothetical protein